MSFRLSLTNMSYEELNEEQKRVLKTRATNEYFAKYSTDETI